MDLEVDHGTHAEEQFWDGKLVVVPARIVGAHRCLELDETLSKECETHSHIDDVLRSYLTLVAESKGWSSQCNNITADSMLTSST
jgi:hypothetical protein